MFNGGITFHETLRNELDKVLAQSISEQRLNKHICVNFTPLDAVAGGLPKGKVTVLAGEQELCSDILANVVLLASASCSVLYVPLHAACLRNAVEKLVLIEANVVDAGKPYTTVERLAIADAVETIRNRGNLGVFQIDCLTLPLLFETLSGELSDDGTFIDGDNLLIVIDGLTMLDDDASLNSIIRGLDSMIGPRAAILTSSTCDFEALRSDLGNAGCIVAVREASVSCKSTGIELNPIKGCSGSNSTTVSLSESGKVFA